MDKKSKTLKPHLPQASSNPYTIRLEIVDPALPCKEASANAPFPLFVLGNCTPKVPFLKYHFGVLSISQIAQWIYYIVDKIRNKERIVINLSLGYECPQTLRATDKALYQALAYAREKGVIVISSVGNKADHKQAEKALCPAQWSNWSSDPVIYSVNSLGIDGLPMANTIKTSSYLKAYGGHAVVQIPKPNNELSRTLTGSSVASLVAAMTAAATWSYRLKLSRKQIMQTIRFQTSNGGAPISMCGTLKNFCKVKQESCPNINADSWCHSSYSTDWSDKLTIKNPIVKAMLFYLPRKVQSFLKISTAFNILKKKSSIHELFYVQQEPPGYPCPNCLLTISPNRDLVALYTDQHSETFTEDVTFNAPILILNTASGEIPLSLAGSYNPRGEKSAISISLPASLQIFSAYLLYEANGGGLHGRTVFSPLMILH